MKKSMIAVAALMITATGVFYSCKKDTITTPATPEPAKQQPSVKRIGSTFMEHMGSRYYDVLPNYDCGDKKGNCIKGTKIKGSKPKIFSEVLSQGNAVATGTFFSDANNHQYIPAVVLNDVKLMEFLSSGLAHGKLLTSASNKEVYLIGESADLTVNNSLVMPVTIEH